MLSVTLQSLEEDGLVSRKIYPVVPPKVEYSLTKSGEGLVSHLHHLVGWALENMQKIVKFEDYKELMIPNTTNALDGQFADLKNKLLNHNGLSKELR